MKIEEVGQRFKIPWLRGYDWCYSLDLVDLAGGGAAAVLPGCDRFVFSPDCNTLATTCQNSELYNDGTVRLWNLPPRRAGRSEYLWALFAPLGVLIVGLFWNRRARPNTA